jgi:DNA-binding transcriptional regulator YiaG
MDWKSHIEGLLSAGATVDQLAVGMGVTPNAVREILAGRTRSPRAEAAFRLAAMKPEHYGSARAQIGQLVDSRMSKRALRARLGLGSDAHLAKILQLPVEQVAAWPEEQGVPLLPQVLLLLGVQEKPAAEAAPNDPDAERVIQVQVA